MPRLHHKFFIQKPKYRSTNYAPLDPYINQTPLSQKYRGEKQI